MLRKAFDGEVFYWYEDNPVVRRTMGRVDPPRSTNAKAYTQADLDRACKEAREAAFKNAIKIVKEQPSTIGDWMTQADVAANLRRKIAWAIEALANSEEGEMNGNDA